MDDQLLSCRCLYLGCKAGQTFGAIRQLLFIIVSLWTNPDWLSSSSSVRWWRWMLWAAGLSQLFMAALFSRSQRSSPSCHKRKNKPSLSPTLFLPPSIESRWLMCELRWGGGGRQVTPTTWPLICRSIMSCNGTAALHECTHYSCIVSALQWTLSAATHTHTHSFSVQKDGDAEVPPWPALQIQIRLCSDVPLLLVGFIISAKQVRPRSFTHDSNSLGHLVESFAPSFWICFNHFKLFKHFEVRTFFHHLYLKAGDLASPK